MKIHELLYEIKLTKNHWELDISNDAKLEVSDDLISLVQTAYSNTPQGSFVNNISNLLPSEWAIIDFDKDPDVDCAIFYRPARSNETWTGYKIQGLGHDGSRDSKDKSLEKLTQLLTKPSWWIEASDALRNVLLKRGLTPISDQNFLQKLFNDPNLHMIDNGTYKRELSDSIITESVFGNPKLR